jgi:nitrite reductase/ring-hydroxylating ferredoxin subunit
MAEWHRVAAEADLLPDIPLGVAVGETRIALVRLADGVHAVSDVCTHAFALLSEGFCEDGRLECPLHQACFDVRTGAVLSEPAEQPLATYKVKVEDGAVFVQV